jgi:hypothetical protein
MEKRSCKQCGNISTTDGPNCLWCAAPFEKTLSLSTLRVINSVVALVVIVGFAGAIVFLRWQREPPPRARENAPGPQDARLATQAEKEPPTVRPDLRPEYQPSDSGKTAEEAYLALRDALNRRDGKAVAKYVLAGKLKIFQTSEELIRDFGSLAQANARIIGSKVVGDKAVLVLECTSSDITENGLPAKGTGVLRLIREGGHWKVFSHLWGWGMPMEPERKDAFRWLEWTAPRGGPEAEAIRKLEAMGEKYNAEYFQFAVARGEIEKVKLFLKAGMSPDTKMQNDTSMNLFDLALLSMSSGEQYEEIVVAMIQAGAGLEGKTPSGLTPLSRAALDCKPRVAKALILAGANLYATDNDGCTALGWARKTCPQLVQELVAAGAR